MHTQKNTMQNINQTELPDTCKDKPRKSEENCLRAQLQTIFPPLTHQRLPLLEHTNHKQMRDQTLQLQQLQRTQSTIIFELLHQYQIFANSPVKLFVLQRCNFALFSMYNSSLQPFIVCVWKLQLAEI